MVLGRRGCGFPQQLDLSTLDGRSGFRIDGGGASERARWAVAGRGDVNNDGVDDFDGDGSLTLFDFLAFQNAFDDGCP